MEIFCFGSGDFVHTIFQAVANMCASIDYGALLKLFALMGLFIGFIDGLIKQVQHPRYVLEKAFRTFVWITVLYHILVIPKKDVIIRDEIFNTQTQVNNVPAGLAVMAHISTTIEKFVARSFDTFFNIPDDLKFTDSGYGFGMLAMHSALQHGVMNPYIRANWNYYISDCFIP
ncbi:MAG: hypothetical protein DRP09_18895, partial [Candidatus Thorarchaeota archaeon]